MSLSLPFVAVFTEDRNMLDSGQSDRSFGARSGASGNPEFIQLFSNWETAKTRKELPEFFVLTEGDAASPTETDKQEPGNKKEEKTAAQPPADLKGDNKPLVQGNGDGSKIGDPAKDNAGRTQERIKAAIDEIQNSLKPLNSNAQKARVGLQACHRQYLQDLEKCAAVEIEIEQSKAKKTPEEEIKPLRNRLEVLIQIVDDIEKNTILQRALVEKPVTARVQIACLRIASGQDKEIAQGEKELLDIVRENPAVQVDPDFSDAVIKAYLQMTAIRRELKLGPWQCNLTLSDQAQTAPQAVGDSKSNDPIQVMKKADEAFWNEGIEKALPVFAEALEAARKTQPAAEQLRLRLFIDGLNLNCKLADAITNGGNIEQLREQRKDLYGAELEANDRAQILRSIEVNIAFAKIASGRQDLFKEGKAELEQCLQRDPRLMVSKEFRDSLRGAFTAHLQAVEKTKPVGKPEAKDQTEPEYKTKVDLSVVYAAPVQNDQEVRKYSSDMATDIGLVALLLGSTMWMLRRQRNNYIANRAIRAEFGPVVVEGAPPTVVLKEPTPDGFKESKIQVKGRMPGTDLMVLRDQSARGDWKDHGSISVPEEFDPKAGKYGDYRRLHVDGSDYYVDKRNRVFVYHRDKLYSTREILLSNPANFEKQTSCINSLMHPSTANAVRDLIYAHEPGSPIYEKVSKFLNIPAPKIEFSVFENSNAAYRLGKGIVVMKPDTKFASSKAALIDRARSMLHELAHMEQDTLSIRRLADNLGIGKTCDDKQLEALQKAYNTAYPGHELDGDFARRVLALRNGVPLTKSEEQRADQLMKDSPRDLVKNAIKANCDRDLALVNALHKLLGTAEVTKNEADINTVKLYKRLSEAPVSRFRDVFGVDPSPEVVKFINQFTSLGEGEVPRSFNVDEAKLALKNCLEKQLQLLHFGDQAPTAKLNAHIVHITECLDDIGAPVRKDPLNVKEFCKRLEKIKDAYDLILGENPPKEIVEIFEKAIAGNTDGWSEEKPRQALRKHLEKRSSEITQLRQLSYFSMGAEQEAWEITRKNDLINMFKGGANRIDQYQLDSYELASKLAGNQNCREIAKKISETMSKPDFVSSTAEQKSKQLTEAVRQLLKEKMSHPSNQLPGSLDWVTIKVGNYDKAGLEYIPRDIKHGREPAFEIRIPENMLRTADGCIAATAEIYADFYAVCEFDVSIHGNSSASTLTKGSTLRASNADSLRALVNHSLKSPESPLFGLNDDAAVTVESRPGNLQPIKLVDFLSDNPTELLEQARTTKSVAEAKACVDKLVELDSPKIDLLKELKSLAKGHSSAVVPALFHIGLQDPQAFDEIMKDHMKNVHLLELIAVGKADPLAFLRLLNSEERAKFLENTWKTLPHGSNAKAALAAAIIAVRPLSTEFLVEVPDAFRSAAAEYLLEARPPGYEKTIYDLMKASPAHAAKLKPILDKLWTSQTQPTDGKTMAVSELLIGDRLQVATKKLAELKWSDGTNYPKALYDKVKALKESNADKIDEFLAGISDSDLRKLVKNHLHDQKRVETFLKDAPDLIKEYEDLHKSLTAEKELQLELSGCLESRRQILENALKEFCRANGLPEPTLKLDDFDGRRTQGEHRFGENSISVRTELVLTGASPSDLVVRVILHETLHLEQGAAVTWDVLDDLKIGEKITDDQRKSAKSEFALRTGGVLRDALLNDVLKIRKGNPLSAEQHLRAVAITKEVYKIGLTNAERRQVSESLRASEYFVVLYDRGTPLSGCLARKTDLVSAAKRLLLIDKLPAALEANLVKLEALGIDSAEAKTLANEVAASLREMITKRRREISSEAFIEYKAGFLEVETGMSDARVLVFREAYKTEDAPKKAKPKPSFGDMLREAALPGADTVNGSNTNGGTASDTKPGIDSTKPGEKPGEELFSIGDNYAKLPQAFKANLLGEINWKVASFLNNPKWDSLKPHEKAEKAKKAVEMMMPLLKQHAKLLGLPEDLVNSESIVFEEMDPGRRGAYSLERDRIRLSVYGGFPVNDVLHELVHKMQWLEIVAAAKADPLGFRMAMMDSCLAGYDLSKTILTDAGTMTRHDFKSEGAKADFKKFVEARMLKEMAREGLIDPANAPDCKATDRLIAEFGGEEELRKFAEVEVENFRKLVKMPGDCKLSTSSQKHVDTLTAKYQRWRHNTAGASLVRLAINEMEKAGKNARDKASYAEIKTRVKKITQRDGRAGEGIQVSDEFIDKVIKEFDAGSVPDIKDPLGVDRTARLDIDPATFETTERSVRDNPLLCKLLSTATIDLVATTAGANGEYAFSSFEISARKIDAAARAKRINQLLKDGRLDKVDRNELQSDFKQLVEFLRFTTKQQQLHQAMLAGDHGKARVLALELVQVLSPDLKAHSDYITFLKNNKLISDRDLGSKPTLVVESKAAPTDKSATAKENVVPATLLDAKERAAAAKVLGQLNPKHVQLKIFADLVDAQMNTTFDPVEKETLRALKRKLASMDPVNGPKFVEAILPSSETEMFSKGATFAEIKGPATPTGGTGGPSGLSVPGMDKPSPTAFRPGPAVKLDGPGKDVLDPSGKKTAEVAAGEGKPLSPERVLEGKGKGTSGYHKNMGRATGILILVDAALGFALQDK